MTTEQFTEFKKYSIKLIKKVFKCNTTKALRTFDWFNLEFGLRIKN
jgi:phenylalanine-4-hydroxylase